MSDSEKTSEDLPKRPSEEIVLKATGPVKVLRGERGRFSQKVMPKTQDITRMLRHLMLQPDTPGGRTRILKVFDNLVKNATASAAAPVYDKLGMPVRNDDGTPLMVTDAKISMASAQNAKILLERVYGAPAKNEEEIEAGKTQSVKVVLVPYPTDLMNKEVKEDKPRPQLKPAFLEAEGFTIDEK